MQPLVNGSNHLYNFLYVYDFLCEAMWGWEKLSGVAFISFGALGLDGEEYVLMVACHFYEYYF